MLWDVAGKDDLADVKLSHLGGAHGYILVADGCRAVTLETAVQLQANITQLHGPLPFVLAVNKADLLPQWEIKRSDIDALGWTCFDTSAKLGSGVDETFLGLAEMMTAEVPGK
jgi:signal recognition particle receptor subunit beta